MLIHPPAQVLQQPEAVFSFGYDLITKQKANREQLFNLFINNTDFANASGVTATFNAIPGGTFSCFNGQITGRYIDIIEHERIVQAWRVEAWPAGVYSLTTLLFPDNDKGTVVELEQVGYPKETKSHLGAGWQKMY